MIFNDSVKNEGLDEFNSFNKFMMGWIPSRIKDGPTVKVDVVF
jgi:hypothetical protein